MNIWYPLGVLSRLKIACLDAERKEAKQNYQGSMKAYVTAMLGRPMEKLNVRIKKILVEQVPHNVFLTRNPKFRNGVQPTGISLSSDYFSVHARLIYNKFLHGIYDLHIVI